MTEIKQNILNVFFLYLDMRDNLHIIRNNASNIIGVTKITINENLKKFNTLNVIFVLKLSYIKFLFPHKLYNNQIEEDQEELDIID